MKKCMITSTLILLLIFCFASCYSGQDVDEIKKRFEHYAPDSNVVAVLDSSTFYFADHTLRLCDIADGEETNNGYLFADGKLYFTTTKENGFFDYSLYVYTCDLYGNNKSLVFEKHGYKTHPWVAGNQESLYIEHYATNAVVASSRVIDSYNIVTGVYRTEATGEAVRLSDYEKDAKGAYLCASENGVLSIVDQQKSATYTIDTAALARNAFNETLDGFDYSFCGFYATTNKMFLLYRIESSGTLYPHLICEYIPDKNEAIFKLLYFADDITTFYIEYL